MSGMVQFQSQEVVLPENLRRQLAVAVRSIQWSYAIFWSLSSRQPGVLEWHDGYYNGDIKTRKTVQAMELKADKVALQRSEQLRELYLSLLEGDIDQQQPKRPSAALSPEDLSDAEWYYLVCMSFDFSIGQGLPGRAFANDQTIWLCNAQYADSKVFSRSLLAKSASIQTVVCFPHLGGVIEIGVTDLIAEDLSLIQHMKASLLDFSKPVCIDETFSAVNNTDNDEEPMRANVDLEIVGTLPLDNLYTSTEEIKFDQEGIDELHADMREEFSIDSLDDCSRGCDHNHQTEDSFMLEGLNGGATGASLVESWHFTDDEFSNGLQDSMTSNNCISEVFAGRNKAVTSPKSGKITNHQLKELQEGNHTKLSSLDLGADDDIHYKRILSVLLKSSNQLIGSWGLGCGNYRSSFVSWKKGKAGFAANGSRPKQNILKKILTAVPLMYDAHSLRSNLGNGAKDCLQRLEKEKVYNKAHTSCETQLENEKFLVLKSMVPSVKSENGKALALDHMIKYLKELEARVEELESCMDSVENDAKPQRNNRETVEQTSDNHVNKKIGNGKQALMHCKRKASDMDESAEPIPWEVKVGMKEDIVIEMRCPYREYILIDVMDEINNLHLDAHSVQSSTINGTLTLTLKSKFRGAAVASAGMIKQALLKIASKC